MEALAFTAAIYGLGMSGHHARLYAQSKDLVEKGLKKCSGIELSGATKSRMPGQSFIYIIT
ncbi:hypothetical protein GCM10027291_22600 [Telluribacter humicola]